MAAIDIGSEAENRSSTSTAGKTFICLDNPANESGTIDTIEIWIQTTSSDCEVAIFSGSGGAGVYTARDSATLGAIIAGEKRTFTGLSLNVVAGDYLGFYMSDGKIETTVGGFAGLLEFAGNGTGGAETYTLNSGDTTSIKGTGSTTVAVSGSGAFRIKRIINI